MKQSVRLAVIAVVVVTMWLLSGQFSSTSPLPQEEKLDSDQIMKVAVIRSRAQTVSREIILQGQLVADEQLILKAETSGSIAELLVEEGDHVKAGQLLLKIQEKDRLAQLTKADADIFNKQLQLKASQKLAAKGLQSATNLAQAKADVAAAKAEKKRWQEDLKHTRISAPFSGVLERRMVTLGSFVDIGNELLEIVDTSRLTAEAYISQQLVNQLTIGQQVYIQLLDGQVTQAPITFISQNAQESTRSFRIEAEFDQPGKSFKAGSSIEMRIITEPVQGHMLPTSLLILNDEGELGVKTVDKDNTVFFHPVKRIKVTKDGMWVSGLPNQADIISRGQNFVISGAQVEPQLATENKL